MNNETGTQWPEPWPLWAVLLYCGLLVCTIPFALFLLYLCQHL